MNSIMSQSHSSLTTALSSIQSLQALGFNSFKLYKSRALWWVGLSNVSVIGRGVK